METELSKKTIERLIHSDSKRLIYEVCQSKNMFQKICVDGTYTEYAKCIKHPTVYIAKYIPNKTGAGGLIYHEQTYHNVQREVSSNQPTLEHYVPSKLSHSEKERITRAVAIAAAEDMLPFTFIEGKGIKRLVNVIADICHSKKGKLDADQMLCRANTVKNNAMKISDEIRKTVKEELEAIDCIYSTCDHWKEDKICRNFFTVTPHYVSKNAMEGCIKSLVLATIETTCKTAKRIEIDYKSIVSGYDIIDKIVSIVTDSANANRSALRYQSTIQWCPWSTRNLNTTLKHAFEITAKDYDYKSIRDIDTMMNYSKDFVTYCKKSGVNSLLHPSLKQTVETRWDSILESLISIKESYDKMKSICDQNEKLKSHLLPINMSLLEEVIKVLKPFKVSREKLCRNIAPTLQEVAVVKKCL